MGTCEYSNETSGSIKCGEMLTSKEPVCFSRRTVLPGVGKYHCYVRELLFCCYIRFFMMYEGGKFMLVVSNM